MDKDQIERATNAARDEARIIASMIGGDAWKIASAVFEKQLAKFLKKVKQSRKQGDYFCADCETKILMYEVANELNSIVNKSLLTRP